MKRLIGISDELYIELIRCNFNEEVKKLAWITSEGELLTLEYRPNFEQIKTYFREEYKIEVVVLPVNAGYYTFKVIDVQCDPNNRIERPPYKGVDGTDYNSYNKALDAGLTEACSLLKREEGNES